MQTQLKKLNHIFMVHLWVMGGRNMCTKAVASIFYDETYKITSQYLHLKLPILYFKLFVVGNFKISNACSYS